MAKEKQEKVDNSIKDVLSEINKIFGENSVTILDSKPETKVETISTGSLGLDLALGVGGYPKGRIIEIFGAPSSGKTTLTLHAINEAQKQNIQCAFIDAEHAFDPDYAKAIGIDTGKLVFNQPDYGEQAFEICLALIKSEKFGLIVIDSVAALTPKAELDGEMGESKMGLHARMMSQAMRKLVAAVNKTHTTLIFINQTRKQIGVPSYGYGGPPDTTTGGEALKFYSSVRLEVKRSSQMKDEGEAYGNKTKVNVVKNKVAPPFKTTEFDIIYGEGISRIAEILHYAVELEIINKSGSWYNYGDIKLGQGSDKVMQLMKDNPEMTKEIEENIIKLINTL